MQEEAIERARLLISQSRYDEAGSILTNAISKDPNNILALILYAEVLIQIDQNTKALEVINSAIAIDPSNDALFYTKSRICIQLEKFDEAEHLIEEAISLYPSDPDYFALWASIKLQRKHFALALELANKALSLDAKNLFALNLRTTALTKLNQKENALETIEGALHEDPNDAYTHANYGWNLLEQNQHEKALEHFKEALKNDPNLDYAQEGMLEALKAKHFIYRWFLKYAFFISNLAEKNQWFFIIGFYVAYRFLSGLAEKVEALQPVLYPILALLFVVAISTWIIGPISNLFLRMNPYGKHLLKRHEILSSNLVGLSILTCILSAIAYLFLRTNFFLALAFFGFSMMVPFSSAFGPNKSNKALSIYAIAMFLIGCVALFFTTGDGELINAFSLLYLLGFFVYQWVANYFTIRESNV